MVDIPAQLQRQIEEVAAYDQQFAEAANLAANPVDPAAAPLSDPAAAAPIEAPAPAAAPVEAPDAETEKWKARYLTLKGMFDADVPRLNAEVKGLRSQLAAAHETIRAAAAAPKPATPAPSAVTDKDTETFGADLVDLITRQSSATVASAKAELADANQKLTAEVAALKEQGKTQAERQVEDNRAKYWGELAVLVPTYEAVNVEDGFKAWLAEADPFSGLLKQQMLQNAFDNFDVKRTALLFNTWIDQQAKPVVPPKTEAQQELERQLSPAGSKSTAPSTQPNDNTRTWSTAEIDLFYRAQSKGEYKGREAEAAAIEASIDLALAQGRIT